MKRLPLHAATSGCRGAALAPEVGAAAGVVCAGAGTEGVVAADVGDGWGTRNGAARDRTVSRCWRRARLVDSDSSRALKEGETRGQNTCAGRSEGVSLFSE